MHRGFIVFNDNAPPSIAGELFALALPLFDAAAPPAPALVEQLQQLRFLIGAPGVF